MTPSIKRSLLIDLLTTNSVIYRDSFNLKLYFQSFSISFYFYAPPLHFKNPKKNLHPSSTIKYGSVPKLIVHIVFSYTLYC